MVLLFGCRKTIEVDFPEEPPQIVLNCLFNPDSSWKINVSKTTFLYDTAKYAPFVDNATVVLYEDEVLLSTLTYADSGNYVANLYPQMGKTYKVVATVPGFAPLEASGSVPTKGTLLSGVFKEEKITLISDLQIPGDFYSIYWSFQDPANTPNFYQMKFVYYDSTYLDNNEAHRPDLFETWWIRTDEPVAEVLGTDQYYILASDESFDGGVKNMVAYTPTNLFYGNILEYQNDSLITPRKRLELYMELNTLSEDMYLFQKSYLQNQFNNINPFAEPINVYSNVKNGLGIFAGYQQNHIRVY